MTVQEPLDASTKYRLRVVDFTTLDEAGAFGDARTELLDGEIHVMNAEYRPHAFAKSELAFRLRDALRDTAYGLHVLVDASVDIGLHDLPLPDVILTTAPRGAGPIPGSSVGLVVEVSASALAKDLTGKAPIYARCGISEYWVVDIERRVIHQLWAPDGDAYRARRDTPFGSSLKAETIAGLIVETDGL